MDTLMASKCSHTSLLTTAVLYCMQDFIGGLICFFVCLFLVILRVCVLLLEFYFITHRGEYGNSNNGIQYKGEFHSGKYHG